MHGYTGERVLVTGGSGFIGRHLVAALAERGAVVRVLLRPGSRLPAAWPPVERCLGDLEDDASLNRACLGMETVFHAAGFAHAGGGSDSAERHRRVNAEGTRRLVQAAVAAGARRLVFFSSVKAMGEGAGQCLDEDWPRPPETPYGQAKRAAEGWVLEAARRHGLHGVNLRLPLVYGAGAKGNLERLVAAVRRGWFPPLPEVGNRRSLVHVADAVAAALTAARHPAAAGGKTYIVTDGQGYSGRRIYELICRGLGRPVPRWAVPAAGLRTLAAAGGAAGRLLGRPVGFDYEVLDKLLGWAWYSSARIERELGYRPAWTLNTALPDIRGGYD